MKLMNSLAAAISDSLKHSKSANTAQCHAVLIYANRNKHENMQNGFKPILDSLPLAKGV